MRMPRIRIRDSAARAPTSSSWCRE
jgi:hypothetical protein